jgi:Ca2+-binding EF-hand superfamily protein
MESPSKQATELAELTYFNSHKPFSVSKEEDLWICKAYSILTEMKSGLSKRDCKKILASLGFDGHEESVRKLVTRITSTDSEPLISFNEFYGILKPQMVNLFS